MEEAKKAPRLSKPEQRAELLELCRFMRDERFSRTDRIAAKQTLLQFLRDAGREGEDLEMDRYRFEYRYDTLKILLAFLNEEECHELGCRLAEMVLSRFERFNHDDRPRKAIFAKRAWLRGKITDQQLKGARDEAYQAGIRAGVYDTAPLVGCTEPDAHAAFAASDAANIWCGKSRNHTDERIDPARNVLAVAMNAMAAMDNRPGIPSEAFYSESFFDQQLDTVLQMLLRGKNTVAMSPEIRSQIAEIRGRLERELFIRL